MRCYKIYSESCISARPVQEISGIKLDELLTQAIDSNAVELIERGRGVLFNSKEALALRAEYKNLESLYFDDEYEGDVDEEMNKIYEHICDLVYKEWEAEGILPEGDWGLVRIDDDENPWDYRPSAW